jgi:hypothetical protein
MKPAPPPLRIVVTGGREADRWVLVAWADGVIVWSDDQVRGGPLYRLACIQSAEIARTVDEISRAGRWVGESRFGPDARWTHMTVCAGLDRLVDVGSWHEIYSLLPDLVVTATGVQPLNGRPPAEVFGRQPDDYLTFRSRWDSVKSAGLRLIPPTGRLIDKADAARMPW